MFWRFYYLLKCFTDSGVMVFSLQVNTFQVVLAYNEKDTYALFLYPEDGLQFFGTRPKNLTMLKLSFQLVWASPEESCPSSSFPGQRGHTTASPAMSSPSNTFTSKQQRNYHFKMRLCSNKITFSFRNNTENYSEMLLYYYLIVIKCY